MIAALSRTFKLHLMLGKTSPACAPAGCCARGHSLGGAIATLCGPWAKATFPNVRLSFCLRPVLELICSLAICHATCLHYTWRSYMIRRKFPPVSHTWQAQVAGGQKPDMHLPPQSKT